MRTLGKSAIYKEKEYEFLDLSNGKYALISNDINDMELGFEKVRDNRYLKSVLLEELDFIFEKDTRVIYKGDEFLGSVIHGNKIMLYTDDPDLGKKYNMIMRDRLEYYLYVDLWEVDEITQKWTPLRKYHNQ